MQSWTSTKFEMSNEFCFYDIYIVLYHISILLYIMIVYSLGALCIYHGKGLSTTWAYISQWLDMH